MIINRFFYAPPAPVYTVSTFAPSLVAKAGSNAAASNYLSTVAAYHDGGFNGGGADDTAFNSAYAPYVSTLPGGGFGRDGSSSSYILVNPISSIYTHKYKHTDIDFTNPGSVHLTTASGETGAFGIYSHDIFTIPYTGYYTPVYSMTNSGSSASSSACYFALAKNTELYNAGLVLITKDCYLGQVETVSCNDSVFSFNLYYKFSPSDSAITTTNYPVSSRVNTVINNYAIQNEGDTYTYITNKPIFDEDTLVFFNPLTGVSFNVTGWYYDYSTRRYTLTYTDNSVSKTATVEYGYNYITVTADGAASNYYYIA